MDENKDNESGTADIYRFRNRTDLILFGLFILIVVAAVTWWLMRGLMPA